MKGIYALGDLVPGPMLAHKAEEEAVVLAKQWNGQPARMDYERIPSVIYTHPEIASIGWSEEHLTASQVPYKKGTFHFRANGRARAVGQVDGWVKTLADPTDGKILGVHILGEVAGELIHEAAVVMRFEVSRTWPKCAMHIRPFQKHLRNRLLPWMSKPFTPEKTKRGVDGINRKPETRTNVPDRRDAHGIWADGSGFHDHDRRALAFRCHRGLCHGLSHAGWDSQPQELFQVFGNEAVVTVACMFVLSSALERTGVIARMGALIDPYVGRNDLSVSLFLLPLVAVLSAFINNTPVVLVFMPMVMAIAARQNIRPSKLLIPLSFASIFGGCCTLIGHFH